LAPEEGLSPGKLRVASYRTAFGVFCSRRSRRCRRSRRFLESYGLQVRPSGEPLVSVFWVRYSRRVMDDEFKTYRRQFLASTFKAGALLALGWTALPKGGLSQGENMKHPETAIFKDDDGMIPNNRYPLLLYRRVINFGSGDPAAQVEEQFAANNWTNSWQNGIYPFHHYHSTSHEVLGVYQGTATVRLGGERGHDFTVQAGDVIVIPAGVGHKNLGASGDFGVVGAYPDGRKWDLLTGKPGERPKADQNIAALPIPDHDPVYGSAGPLREIWV
jgi:uncharacterized protein YjlB